MNTEFLSLRCPSKRPHRVTSDGAFVDYETCGAFMGAISSTDTEDNFFSYCPKCKTMWNILVDFYGTIIMKKVRGKLKVSDTIRIVE